MFKKIVGMGLFLFATQTMASSVGNYCLRYITRHVEGNNLALDACDFKSQDLPPILKFLAQHPEVTSLQLDGANFNDHDMELLAKSPYITDLSLSFVTIDAGGIYAL